MAAKFPTALPESLRKLLPSGCSLFPRPEKRRWVFAYEAKGGGRPQKVIPGEIVEPRAAVEYVVTFLRAQGIDPGANLDRRKVEGPTVGACADKWIALAEKDPKVAPATLAGYRYHLKAHIRPTFEDTPIVALPRMVPELRKWIRDGFPNASARTVHHAVSAFTVLVDVAIAEQWIRVEGDDWTRHAVNPLRSPAVRDILPEAEDHDPQALPLATVRALIHAVDRVPLERRTRYAVGFTAGLRDGELAGVKVGRIQRSEVPHTIEVVVSVATVGSKVEGKTKWALPKAPKTKGSKRKLPLHPCADAAIGEWLAVGWPELVGRFPTEDDYLFPRPDGQPSRPRSAEMLRADLKACGLPTTIDARPVEFKATRSTFATWLDDAGVDRAVRKRLLGHVVSDVTERHYTRREIEQLAAAVARIDLEWPVLVPAGGTLPAMVPTGTAIDSNQLESLSHLRDLNSRPTVYEGGGSVPPVVPTGLHRRRKRRQTQPSNNGRRVDNGLENPPPRGAATVAVVPPDATILANLKATHWGRTGQPQGTIPAGLVEAEALDLAALRRGVEVRQLLGEGMALAFARVGDPAGFDAMEVLLGRMVELVQTGGAS